MAQSRSSEALVEGETTSAIAGWLVESAAAARRK